MSSKYKYYGAPSVQELRRKFYVRRTWKMPDVVTQERNNNNGGGKAKQIKNKNKNKNNNNNKNNNQNNGNSLMLASRYNLLLQSVRLDRASQGKVDVTAQYQASLTQLSNRHKQRPLATPQRASVKPGMIAKATPANARATRQRNATQHKRNGSSNSGGARTRPVQGDKVLKMKRQHGEGTLKQARERREKVDDRKVNRRLVSVYVAQTRPDLLPNVDAMLKRYEGKESVLLRRLARGDMKQGINGTNKSKPSDSHKQMMQEQLSKKKETMRNKKAELSSKKQVAPSKSKRRPETTRMKRGPKKGQQTLKASNARQALPITPPPLPPLPRNQHKAEENNFGDAIRRVIFSPVTWLHNHTRSNEDPPYTAMDETEPIQEEPASPEELPKPPTVPKLPKAGYVTYPTREKRSSGGTDMSPTRWSASMLSEGRVASGGKYEGWDVGPGFTLRRKKKANNNNAGFVNEISAPAGRVETNPNNNSGVKNTGSALQTQYSLFEADRVTAAGEEYVPALDSGTLDVAVMREILYSFLAVYAPERIPRLDAELALYAGHEEDLFKILESQFGVTFGSDGYARVELGLDGDLDGNGNVGVSVSGNGYFENNRDGGVDVTDTDDLELEEALVQFLKKRDGMLESIDTREKASDLLERYTIGNLGRALMNMHHELPVGWSEEIAKRREKKKKGKKKKKRR